MRYLEELRSKGIARLILLSVLLGTMSGLGALLFNTVLESSSRLLLRGVAQYEPPAPGGERISDDIAPEVQVPQPPNRRWLLILVPALGGLAAGLIVFSFAPEAEGHGTDAMIDSFHQGKGHIRPRVPLVKMLASALTIGSGGSAGREGPIAQIGAGIGSFLATKLNLTDRERRLFVLAGAGAGIGAIFHAPLGGALIATEVLYKEPEFESEAIIPTFISSIVAYSVYCPLAGFGWGAIFTNIEGLRFEHPSVLPLFALLGILCALVGILYVKFFYGVRALFLEKWKVRPHLKPAVGGLLVGLIAYFRPEVLGMGYGWIQKAIDGQLGLAIMAQLVLLKIVATSLTIGSGGSGGVFAPSLVIGGLLGGVFGQLCHMFLPDLVGLSDMPAFVLVGMAGFFGGIAKVPVSALIMVSEMSSGYGLLVPLMLTTILAYLFTGERYTLYDKQVSARIDSPAHRGHFTLDILKAVTVREALSAISETDLIREDMPLRQILSRVTESNRSTFPVVNASQEVSGIITLDDIRRIFTETDLYESALIIAKDVGDAKFTHLDPDEDLNSALTKLADAEYDELPVLTQDTPARVIGMLSRRDLILAYNRKMDELRSA